MLSAQALGALDAAEARALEVHLATCAECRAELDSWQETAAALAYVAAPVAAPSSDLRARILERARAVRPAAAARVSKDEHTGVEENGANESAAAPASNVIRMPRGSRRAWSGSEIFYAIAASLIIAALAVSVVILWQRNQRAQEELTRRAVKLNQAEQELARVRADRDFLAAPEANTRMLAGTKMAAGARAKLAYDDKTGRAILVADGLPPAPAGKAYQLWFIADGKPLPGGVFITDGSGHGELRDQIPPAGRQAAVFAVTLEREGGVPAPEGQIYLVTPTS